MKTLHNSLVLLGALSAAGACAQAPPPDAPAPPPPPAGPAAPVPPVPPNAPGVMTPYRMPMRQGYFAGMVGNQASYVYEVIRTNKDELKVTDAQWKTIQDTLTAAEKTRMERGMQSMNIRRELQDLVDADTPELAKIEPKIRELKKYEGDDMLADFKLAGLYRNALTEEQRKKLPSLSPKFEPYMPLPDRPGMPGPMGVPVGPGMMPGTPPGAHPTPPPPPIVAPGPLPNPPRP